jgi:hypothetical protein
MSKSAQDLTRKDIKAPDKFQVAATEAATWATAHGRSILIGAVGVLVFVVAAVAFTAWRSSRAERAGSLLYQALAAASGEVSASAPEGGSTPVYKDDAEW